MRSIHIGIGHDDDLMIAELFFVEFASNSTPESRNHIFNFIGIENFIQTGFFHVENLASERKYRLSLPVPARFCGSSRGISLDEKNFGESRIFFTAVR